VFLLRVLCVSALDFLEGCHKADAASTPLQTASVDSFLLDAKLSAKIFVLPYCCA
jgi:hypothetical protein